MLEQVNESLGQLEDCFQDVASHSGCWIPQGHNISYGWIDETRLLATLQIIGHGSSSKYSNEKVEAKRNFSSLFGHVFRAIESDVIHERFQIYETLFKGLELITYWLGQRLYEPGLSIVVFEFVRNQNEAFD